MLIMFFLIHFVVSEGGPSIYSDWSEQANGPTFPVSFVYQFVHMAVHVIF